MALMTSQNIWLSSTVTSGQWDQKTGLYTLAVNRKDTPTVITAKHVVIATGAGSQTPVMPLLANKVNRHSMYNFKKRHFKLNGLKGQIPGSGVALCRL